MTLGEVAGCGARGRARPTVVDTGVGAWCGPCPGQVLGKGRVLAVDQTATAYAIDGAGTEVLARLGYATDDVAPVPGLDRAAPVGADAVGL